MLRNLFSISNVLILAIVLLVFTLRGPQIIALFKLEGGTAKDIGSLTDIHGNYVNQEGAMALIFWATWCGPCELELGRINSLIQKSKILPKKVVAISVDEDSQVVKDTVQSRNYLFPVVWDKGGILSATYKVSGTPTVIIINPEKKIAWASSGISPSLEFRMTKHLK